MFGTCFRFCQIQNTISKPALVPESFQKPGPRLHSVFIGSDSPESPFQEVDSLFDQVFHDAAL